MNISSQITKLENELNELAEEVQFLQKNAKVISGCPFPVTFSGKKTRVIIGKISELTEARQFMHALFGTRKFEYVHSFYSMGTTITTYENDDVSWRIWLECSVDDFPDELMKNNGCKWVGTEQTDYNLVCDLQE